MTRNRTKSSRRLTVALCVIARDEEQFIGDCIDSARPFVDEVIVLDTGSLDRTREIAREHGARVEHFTWCDDFAAARNAAVDAVKTDWILMLDADERLAPEGGPLLMTFASMAPVIPNGINGFCPLIVSQSISGEGGRSVANRVMRFFPRLTGLRWVGAVHEDLQYLPEPGRLRSIAMDSVRIVHFGYDRAIYAARGKDERNTRLLEQEIARNPNDARTLFFLGQQHFAMRRHSDAIEAFTAFLERADQAPAEFSVEIFAMLLRSLLAVQDTVGFERVARRAESAGLVSADARGVLAAYEQSRMRFDAAEQHLIKALERDQPVGVTVDEGIGSWATRLQLAQVHEVMGKSGDALEDLQLAFATLPERMHGHVAAEAASLALRCEQAAIAEGWLQIAYDAAMSSDLDGDASVAQLVRVATALKKAGVSEAALDVLNRVLDTDDVPEAAYWLLLGTLTELGRYEDADATLELMRLRGIKAEVALAA